MTVQMLKHISNLLYVLGGIQGSLAIFLFFRWKMLQLFFQVSGRNAKQEIRRIREKNSCKEQGMEKMLLLGEDKPETGSMRESTELLETMPLASSYQLEEEIGYMESQGLMD